MEAHGQVRHVGLPAEDALAGRNLLRAVVVAVDEAEHGQRVKVGTEQLAVEGARHGQGVKPVVVLQLAVQRVKTLRQTRQVYFL